MATPKVITALIEDRDNWKVGETPFKVELKGQAVPEIKAKRVQNLATGALSVQIIAPVTFALSTLDKIAQNILTGAKVREYRKGSVIVREYSR
jgi:hypothetical protein